MRFFISLAGLAATVSAAPSLPSSSALVDPIPSSLLPSTFSTIVTPEISILPIPITTLLPDTTVAPPSIPATTPAPTSTWSEPSRVNDSPFTRAVPPLNNTVTGPCEVVKCRSGFECHVYGDEAKCVAVGGSQCGTVWCPGNMSCCNASCSVCVPPDFMCTQQFCGDIEEEVDTST
ncbi:hypothetical protein Cpir12675_002348 [Ceratocystis pirilliformis]|uniref:Uncharacterized protein n=1 Tax=Ceratocystis pirilliformis TaxID=259994 RepID=A0ABR3ZBJ4_9PEZI